jgi:hypothetical protein
MSNWMLDGECWCLSTEAMIASFILGSWPLLALFFGLQRDSRQYPEPDTVQETELPYAMGTF